MHKTWNNQPFESNPALASTLDASWYLDPEVYQLELRTYLCPYLATHHQNSEVEPTRRLCHGDGCRASLSWVLRDDANRLRAFYNVCPHRAGSIARGAGSRKSLQCAYHGWTFDLNGCLMNTPYFFEVEDFDPERYNLREVRLDTWGSLRFRQPR
jgi:choline monooxygenase